MITVDQTIRSYSGRRGCMCGCQGTYNTGERARKLALTQILKDSAVRLQTWDTQDEDKGCVFVETDTRNRVLYLTADGVEAARAMGIEEV